MRTALQVVFELPRSRQPNFLVGKLRDLVTLVVVGLTLLVSVALSGVVTRFSTELLDLADLDHDLSWIVEVGRRGGRRWSPTRCSSSCSSPSSPAHARRTARCGRAPLLGSLAFEVLKQLSSFLLAATQRSPAFQAFGIALILLVWINYFSRIVMYAAAWAYTSPSARAARERESRLLSPDSLALRARVAAARAGVPASPETVVAPRRDAGRGGPRPAPRLRGGCRDRLGLVVMLRRRRD